MHAHATPSRFAPWRRTLGAGLIVALSAIAFAQDGAPPAADETPPAEPAAAVDEEVGWRLKPRDHDELGKLVADYYTAVAESKGILAATEALDKKMAAIAKREKLDTLLGLAADWERVLALAKSFPANPQGKGRIRVQDFKGVWGDDIQYAVHGPKGYKNSEPVPLVIIVPDKDQKIEEIIQRDWIEKGTGVEDEMILVCTKMPSSLDSWTSTGEKGKPGGVDRILQVYKHASREWNVDLERVFLVGMEDGVAAVVRAAALFPDRFAGVVGRSGDPKSAAIRNFSNLPLLLAAGSTNASAMATAAEKLGWKHLETEPSAETVDIVNWMRTKSRSAHPKVVELEPLEEVGKNAYWLRVEGFDVAKNPWVKGTIDRESNTVTIEGSGVSQVVLFFTDRLVDLDRPVKVVVGGVTHEHRFERDLEFMLQRARSSGDPGRAYLAQRPYDFPQ
jgi:hypothetical protein